MRSRQSSRPHSHTIETFSVMALNASLSDSSRSFTSRKRTSFSPMRRARSSTSRSPIRRHRILSLLDDNVAVPLGDDALVLVRVTRQLEEVRRLGAHGGVVLRLEQDDGRAVLARALADVRRPLLDAEHAAA